MKVSTLFCVGIMALTIAGCIYTTPDQVLKEQGHRAATLNIREHVFASQPLWESSLTMPKRTLDVRKLSLNDLRALAPSLWALRAQAEGRPDDAAKLIPPDELPPPTLMSTDVMAAFVNAMSAQIIGQSQLLNRQAIDVDTKSLLNQSLTFDDFWKFRAELSKIAVAVFQDTQESSKRRSANLDCPKDQNIKWQCLFIGYFTSYYNGKFVDREGGTLSKPKLGMAISNETITGFVTAALEATYDWVVLREKLKVPVVYNGDPRNRQWQNAKGVEPTFATVLLAMQTQPPDELPPFIVKLTDGKKAGMSKLKLCGIRLVSGLAADAAQPLSGAIFRLFGGAEAGPFVVFGKFSFGDNETMAKLVDTFVEVTSLRLTAGAASHLVYDIVDADLPGFIPKGLAILTECHD